MAGGARLIAAPSAEVLARAHAAIFADAWSRRTLAELLASPGVTALLARCEDRDLGLVIWRIAADEGEIVTIGVMPSAVGQGIGTGLLRTACAAMRLSGCRTVFLEVAVGNESAKRLYTGAGFETVGLRKGYYRKAAGKYRDAAIMRLDL